MRSRLMNCLNPCSAQSEGREEARIDGNHRGTTTDPCRRFLPIRAVTSGALAKSGERGAAREKGRSRNDRVICAKRFLYAGSFV
jgi:hypothetical protein